MLRLYVNGGLAASQARTGNVQTNGNPLWIGGTFRTGSTSLGVSDEVRIYSRALSPLEIQTDMATPVGP
jgi:hypothetical protein